MTIMKLLTTAALLLCAALAFCSCGSSVEVPAGSPVPTIDGGASSPAPEPGSAYRRATVYYLSDEGYIVPTVKHIPWEEGIAKACLSCLISTEANRAAAAKLGLRTVIPEGVELELNIEDGSATLNLKNLPDLGSAAAEKAMLSAIVNTLTEFDTISTVTITVNGQLIQALPHGTKLPNGQGRYTLNIENEDVATSGGVNAMQLYFPNVSGSMDVPVTRYTSSEVDLYSNINGLIAGTSLKGLRSCFPENTLLLAATIENGMVSVNLSEDFKSVSETPGLYSLAERTVLRVAQLYGEVSGVNFLVNGEPYAP